MTDFSSSLSLLLGAERAVMQKQTYWIQWQTWCLLSDLLLTVHLWVYCFIILRLSFFIGGSRDRFLSQLTSHGYWELLFSSQTQRICFNTSIIDDSLVVAFLLKCYLTPASIHIPHLFPASIWLALNKSMVTNFDFSTHPCPALHRTPCMFCPS